MKKTAFILSFVALISFSSCGGEKDTKTDTQEEPKTEEASSETENAEEPKNTDDTATGGEATDDEPHSTDETTVEQP